VVTHFSAQPRLDGGALPTVNLDGCTLAVGSGGDDFFGVDVQDGHAHVLNTTRRTVLYRTSLAAKAMALVGTSGDIARQLTATSGTGRTGAAASWGTLTIPETPFPGSCGGTYSGTAGAQDCSPGFVGGGVAPFLYPVTLDLETQGWTTLEADFFDPARTPFLGTIYPTPTPGPGSGAGLEGTEEWRMLPSAGASCVAGFANFTGFVFGGTVRATIESDFTGRSKITHRVETLRLLTLGATPARSRFFVIVTQVGHGRHFAGIIDGDGAVVHQAQGYDVAGKVPLAFLTGNDRAVVWLRAADVFGTSPEIVLTDFVAGTDTVVSTDLPAFLSHTYRGIRPGALYAGAEGERRFVAPGTLATTPATDAALAEYAALLDLPAGITPAPRPVLGEAADVQAEYRAVKEGPFAGASS
jgi:hypothetical protein